MREPIYRSCSSLEVSHVSYSKSSITLRFYQYVCHPFGLQLQIYEKISNDFVTLSTYVLELAHVRQSSNEFDSALT